MKITLIFTGKTKIDYIQEGMDDYRKRLKHYFPLDIVILNDLKNTRNMTMKEQMHKEAEQLLKVIPAGSLLILLDERGKQFGSLEFAEFLQDKMNEGRDLCYIVGGPYGFSETIYQKSDMKMALSKLTFSHQMVRLIMMEQLYRAFTIIKGEPYHNV